MSNSDFFFAHMIDFLLGPVGLSFDTVFDINVNVIKGSKNLEFSLSFKILETKSSLYRYFPEKIRNLKNQKICSFLTLYATKI